MNSPLVLNRVEYARFMRQVRVGTESVPEVVGPHWIWVGAFMPNGYGKHRRGPGHKERAAHRLSYEHHKGAIPDGLELDHLCRTRACVNPDHLEPVTGAVNTDRQDHANRAKTHCPKGHAYTPDNTRTTPSGKRVCRACERIRAESRAPR